MTIVVLAAVLGLQAADVAAVGAVAVPIERGLDIGNVGLGLLVTASTLVGAVFTLPAGALVDRVNRLRLLVGAVVLWSFGMLVSGLAVSYTMLLLTRLSLGAVVAVAGPAVSSLIGDLVEPDDRGRVYGYVLLGELVGAGAGLLLAGTIADVWSWRVSFAALAVPGVALAWMLSRVLSEPPRRHTERSVEPTEPGTGDALAAAIERRGIGARQAPPPADLEHATLARAVSYVLTIPTNVVLIIGSGLGYFFFSGIRTFGVEYLRGRYGLGQAAASALVVLVGVGAIVGVLVTGRLADRLIGTGTIAARPIVAGAAFVVAAVVFVPAVLIPTAVIAVPLMFVGAAAYGGTNAPLDAARLDVVPGALWGRAEGARTLLRTLLEAGAPLLFGYLSTVLGGRAAVSASDVPGAAGRVAAVHAGVPLARTFLIMLVPMAVGGVLLLTIARRTYPTDVATALARGDASPVPAHRSDG